MDVEISPITPKLLLELHIIGSKRPPFILKAVGDLTWMQGLSVGDTRTITVWSVETHKDSEAPILKCDLSFLDFKLLSKKKEPYTEPGTYKITYHYQSAIIARPRTERLHRKFWSFPSGAILRRA